MVKRYSGLKDTSSMPFGKYRGQAMIDVPASYLLYLYDEMDVSEGAVRDYIEDNLDVLREQVKQDK